MNGEESAFDRGLRWGRNEKVPMIYGAFADDGK
jgi:hypothetical protein